jgi:hypothetical protein
MCRSIALVSIFLPLTLLQCIAELKEKAEHFKATRLIAVMDAEATVVKSDSVVSADLTTALKQGVKPLENVPDHMKDWHPGSNEMVLDLVHPSLCPLIYGTSRALPYRTVPLKECSKYCGEGETATKGDSGVSQHTLRLNGWNNTVSLPAWGSFQWLPADIKFRGDGSASIDSYINNLHPVMHAELYHTLEHFVDCAVPLWNEALSWFHDRIRIKVDRSSDEDFYIPDGMKYEGASGHSSDSDFFWNDDGYRDWKEDVQVLTQREPNDFVPHAQRISDNPTGAKPVDLRTKFADSGLQVIFKLANILLTPEKPEYEGGSWHVEGALNEHICATALYYYDQDNITDSYLSFRQSIDAEEMTMIPAQNEHKSLEMYYGVEQDGPCLQELGQVLTRQGRILAFPNVLQHCVHNFRLKDETKPGHRKILAMFLVDPHIRVLSTANVPPQQKDWWSEEVRKVAPLADMPQEIFDKIIEDVDDFPLSYEAACEVRDQLMAERGAMNNDLNECVNPRVKDSITLHACTFILWPLHQRQRMEVHRCRMWYCTYSR